MQTIADHSAQRPSLVSVHRSLSGLHVTRRPGLDFDEAEHVFVPADEINFAVMPRRPKIARHHHVPVTAQIEVGVFFSAAAGAVMRGILPRVFLPRNSIEKTKSGLREPAS